MKENLDDLLGNAGLVGGGMLGLVNIFRVAFAPVPQPKWKIIRAIAESICSTVSGWAGARFVAPAVCLRGHITAVEDITAIGFFFGAAFWLTFPLVIGMILKWAANKTGNAEVTVKPVDTSLQP